MNIISWAFISVSACILGILLLCITQEWIIIYIPHYILPISTHTSEQAVGQSVKLYRWHDHTWHTHNIKHMYLPSKQPEIIAAITTAWLSMMHEELVYAHPITLQAVSVSAHQDIAYLSFYDTLTQANKSTYENLMCIEGLLRTLREQNIPHLRSCMFLVHHKPMHDAYIDLSCSWPLEGFAYSALQTK